jgi:hypothetical protein
VPLTQTRPVAAHVAAAGLGAPHVPLAPGGAAAATLQTSPLAQQGDLVPAAQARPDLAHFVFGAAAAAGGAAARSSASASASASAAPWRAILRLVRWGVGELERAALDHRRVFEDGRQGRGAAA